MTRLPSHDRALAAAIRLEAWARAERATADALRKLGPIANPELTDSRAALLEEVAEWVHWMAGHAPRLAELEIPIRKPNTYGRRA